MEIKHSENYYSEPVQEILGSIPSWITRWGVTIIFGVFAMIIIGCCLIDYPQTLTAPITVTVSEDGTITGEAMVPSPGFGKVQVGQKVNVRLECYPYMEYGILIGKVSSFSSIPTCSTRGVSTYSTTISFNHNDSCRLARMSFSLLKEQSGTALIITQERKVIDHIIPINRLRERKKLKILKRVSTN